MRRDGNLQSYFSTKILAIFWLYNDVQTDDRQEGSETTLTWSTNNKVRSTGWEVVVEFTSYLT